MIVSKCVDIEIFVNLFSVTFVSLQDYLNKFKDCVDDKGKPKALTECLSVKEIIARLATVQRDIFYISDTDDSQLLELVNYINSMQAYYDTKTDAEGKVYQTPVRYDLFGFNNQDYDDMMIKAFLMYFNRFTNTKELIKFLKEFSNKIIRLQNDKESYYEDKEIELIRSYRLPYTTVDVQKVYKLHTAGVNIDKNTGERIKFGKSLKQTSINLKWHNLLDFTLPPIDDEEANIYWRKKETYRNFSLEQLNSLITEDFDRYVLPKYVKPMLDYNINDVFLVAEIVRQKPDEVKLRYSITKAFGINVLCSARANIADKLLTKYYSDKSGLHKSKFEKLRTERTKLSFDKVIFPHIQFKTKQLQDLLAEMKKVSIYHVNKTSFCREIDFYGTKYTLATGGIHTQDNPGIYESKNGEYEYVHWDYNSYYPSIIVSYNLSPKHLVNKIFVELVRFFRDTRVKCKHTKDEEGLVISGVPNKVAAEVLKIVINSIYGKFGSDTFWLYDRLTQLQVTINGQLMTMSLVEALELEGIHVISANTDGIVIKLPNDKKEVFKEITAKWNQDNKMNADGEEYKLLVTRDINNYLNVQIDDSIEFKGALDPKQYIKDLAKGYDMPIVAYAVSEYFIHDIPIMDTLHNHKDILDFCKTQNVGKQFNVVYQQVKDGKVTEIESQRHCRFYVSTKGVVIQKKHKTTNQYSRLASGKRVVILNQLDDTPIEDRNIDYKYYYEECYKIIDPIKLQISASAKGDAKRGIKSGKVLLKKYSHQYNSLFDYEQTE